MPDALANPNNEIEAAFRKLTDAEFERVMDAIEILSEFFGKVDAGSVIRG